MAKITEQQVKNEVFIKLETAVEKFTKNFNFIKSGKMKYDKSEEEMKKYGFANSIPTFKFIIEETTYEVELTTKFYFKKENPSDKKLGTNLILKVNGTEYKSFKAIEIIEEILVKRTKMKLENFDRILEIIVKYTQEDIENITKGDYIRKKKYYITKEGVSSVRPDNEKYMIIITNPYLLFVEWNERRDEAMGTVDPQDFSIEKEMKKFETEKIVPTISALLGK